MGFLEYLSFLRIDDGKRRPAEPNASVATVALAVPPLYPDAAAIPAGLLACAMTIGTGCATSLNGP